MPDNTGTYLFRARQAAELIARARADDTNHQPPRRRHRTPPLRHWFPPAPQPTPLHYALPEALSRPPGGPAWDRLPRYVQRCRAVAHVPIRRALLAHGWIPPKGSENTS